MSDEVRLIEKLRLIEALFGGAATEGERDAAGRARQRILERLHRVEREDPPVEFHFSMPDMWNRKVFVALLRRYGIKPYRYTRQRHTTVMARVPRGFVDETLWPEYEQISDTLSTYLTEVTDRVVAEVIHQDHSEAEVVEKPAQLPSPGPPPPSPSPSPPQPDRSDQARSVNREKLKRKKKKRKKRKR